MGATTPHKTHTPTPSSGESNSEHRDSERDWTRHQGVVALWTRCSSPVRSRRVRATGSNSVFVSEADGIGRIARAERGGVDRGSGGEQERRAGEEERRRGEERRGGGGEERGGGRKRPRLVPAHCGEA
eukprot:2111009-Rhodomonas_salina.1